MPLQARVFISKSADNEEKKYVFPELFHEIVVGTPERLDSLGLTPFGIPFVT
jgi:hypothetical protein